MHDLTAKRTLVKSPPELWSELSEVERLARHLGAFGEIKITKLEPEHTVAWEGDAASGTVMIEPSGWGTKVTLQAQVQAPEEDKPRAAAEQAAKRGTGPEVEAGREAEPEPPAEAIADLFGTEPGPPIRTGFFARLFGWGPREEPLLPVPERALEPQMNQAAPEPVAAQPQPEAEPEPVAAQPEADAQPTATAPALATDEAQAVLEDVLEALGSAHHRPFSRG